ncbi:glycosyltransferase family protein [Sulfurimonas sp.]|uniref:glycosyltransferase family protein n=1 Tax=Sulfurimonas sp. TaxID=2022749 RepID=UPI002AB2D1FB|nr:glycosyltransferase family protein [Sulfurimonas sp.]
MKIIASIECRMTSSRLPGKVLMNALDNMSMLEVMVKRVKHSKLIDGIILATTINKDDDVIVELAKKLNVDYFRGSEDDVLSRVVQSHESVKSDVIVELTGDCPLIDPALIDQCVKVYLDNNYDYVSNNYKRTFPDGSDVQVFSLDVLQEANLNTKNPLDREHVSKYIYENARYSIYTIEAIDSYYWPTLAVTLDEKEDYELLKDIFNYFDNIDFTTLDYIEYLKNNMDLLEINAHIKRKGLN